MKFRMRGPTKNSPGIPSFRGKLFFLSNFYPCTVKIADMTFPTSEHAYVWYKMGCPKDFSTYLTMQPGGVKRSARFKGGGYWERSSVEIMKKILVAKFSQNWELGRRLISVNPNDLVEKNNWHDIFWGKCFCEQHDGIGANMLGRLLSDIRDDLIKETSV